MASVPEKPTVLVVDDDDDLREVLCDVLESEGFGVVGVRDGRAALEAAERATLELAVLDRHHPGPNGPVLLEALWLRHPGLKVLVISGAGTEAVPGTHRLAKPFSMSELVGALDRLRSAPAAAGAS